MSSNLTHAVPDLQTDLAEVRRTAARDDPDSLYSRLLKTLRHETGWHWNRDSIETALKSLGDTELPAFAATEDLLKSSQPFQCRATP